MNTKNERPGNLGAVKFPKASTGKPLVKLPGKINGNVIARRQPHSEVQAGAMIIPNYSTLLSCNSCRYHIVSANSVPTLFMN